MKWTFLLLLFLSLTLSAFGDSVAISLLPAATNSDGSEVFPVVQHGTTKKMTPAQLLAGFPAQTASGATNHTATISVTGNYSMIGDTNGLFTTNLIYAVNTTFSNILLTFPPSFANTIAVENDGTNLVVMTNSAGVTFKIQNGTNTPTYATVATNAYPMKVMTFAMLNPTNIFITSEYRTKADIAGIADAEISTKADPIGAAAAVQALGSNPTNRFFAKTFTSTNGYFVFSLNPDGSTNVNFVVTNAIFANTATSATSATTAVAAQTISIGVTNMVAGSNSTVSISGATATVSGVVNLNNSIGVAPLANLPTIPATQTSGFNNGAFGDTNNISAAALTAGTVPTARLGAGVIQTNSNALTLTNNGTISGLTPQSLVTSNEASQIAANTAGVLPSNAVTTNQTKFTGQTWVDKSGNDMNGLAENLVFPFYTIKAAKENSSGTNTIHVGIGIFNRDYDLLTNNVNLDFQAGSTVAFTNFLNPSGGNFVQPPLFSDSSYLFITNTSDGGVGSFNGYYSFPYPRSNGTTNIITGSANLSYTYNTTFSGEQGGGLDRKQGAFIWLTRTNTIFHANFDSINEFDTNNVAGIIMNGESGANYNMEFKSVNWNHLIDNFNEGDFSGFDGNLRSPFDWGSGNANLTIDNITVSNWADCFDVSDIGSAAVNGFTVEDASVLTVHGKVWNARNSFGNAIWGYGSANIVQRETFIVDDIFGGTNSAVDWVSGGGKVYIIGSLMEGNSSNAPVIYYESDFYNNTGGTVTNQLWVTEQKIIDNLGGGFIGYNGTRTNTGNMDYNVSEWQEKAPIAQNIGSVFKINTGTHYFHGSSKPLIIKNGRGFGITNANVTIKDLTLDTSASAVPIVNNCIYIEGVQSNNYLELDNCTLISAAGVNAIDATNAQNVILNNCRIIGGGISSNVVVSLVGTNWFGNGSVAGNFLVKGGVQILGQTTVSNISGANATFTNSILLNGIPVLTNVVFGLNILNVNPHIPTQVTLGASPFLFSNATSNSLECYFSGSVAYSVSKNGVGVFGSLAGDGYMMLQPTNSCTITYSVAPTFYTNAW